MADGRASAPTAIGVVGIVAVAAAAAVVLLAPQATPENDGQPTFETEVPTALADGSALPDVPAELDGVVEGPVVLAHRSDELPDGVSCDFILPWDEEPDIEAVFITPTAAQASMVGEASIPIERMHGPEAPDPEAPEEEHETEEMRGTCRLVPSNGGWSESGGGGGTAPQPGPPGSSNSTGSSCCENGHGTAYADVSVAGDVAWLLQDRGPYWLAYPADGLDFVTVEWPFPQSLMGAGRVPPSRVRVLDADGDVIAERLVGR